MAQAGSISPRSSDRSWCQVSDCVEPQDAVSSRLTQRQAHSHLIHNRPIHTQYAAYTTATRRSTLSAAFLTLQAAFLAQEEHPPEHSDDEEEEHEGICGEALRPRVDGTWSYVVVSAAIVSTMLAEGLVFSTGIYLDTWAQYLHEDLASVAVVSSVIRGTYFFAAPLASALIAVFECRLVALAGAVLAIIGLVGASFCCRISLIIFTYGFLGGVGCCFLLVTSVAITSQYCDKMRLVTLCMLSCGSGVGFTLLSYLTSYLLKHMSWQHSVLITAGLLSLSIPAAFTYRPLRYRMLLNHVTIKESLKKTFDFDILKMITFWILAVRSFVVTFGISMPIQLLPSVAANMDISHYMADSLLTILALANVFARILISLMVYFVVFNPSYISSSMLVCGGMVTLLHEYYVTYVHSAVFAGIFGIVKAFHAALGTVGLTYALGADRLLGAFGFMCVCSGAADLVAGPLGVKLYERSKTWSSMLYVSGSAILFAGLSSLMMLCGTMLYRLYTGADKDAALTNSDSSAESESDGLLSGGRRHRHYAAVNS